MANDTSKKKVGLHSIKNKMLLVTMASGIMSILICLFLTVPVVKESLVSVSEDYLADMTKTYCETINKMEANRGEGELSSSEYAEVLQDAKIQGMSTSYFYMVSGDGTMLYHPDESKIGSTVENEIVKGLVSQLQSGTVPEDDVADYEYNGSLKYAAYNITDNQDILVLTVDGSEVLAPAQNVYKRDLIALLVVILLSGPVSYFVASKMADPIIKLAGIVEKAANLNFEHDEYLDKVRRQKDETGLIGGAVSDLQEELRRVVQVLQEQSNEVYLSSNTMNGGAKRAAAAVSQVEKAVDEIAQGATSQAEDTSSAGEQIAGMGEMIQGVNEAVGELDRSTEGVQQASNQAADILRELQEINEKVTNYIDMVEQQTLETNSSAQHIKTATELITAIAEETNLLSLNATIEAARAGGAWQGIQCGCIPDSEAG